MCESDVKFIKKHIRRGDMITATEYVVAHFSDIVREWLVHLPYPTGTINGSETVAMEMQTFFRVKMNICLPIAQTLTNAMGQWYRNGIDVEYNRWLEHGPKSHSRQRELALLRTLAAGALVINLDGSVLVGPAFPTLPTYDELFEND